MLNKFSVKIAAKAVEAPSRGIIAHSALSRRFPAYWNASDYCAWLGFRVACLAILFFLMVPVLAIIPLSFTDSSFLMYPIKGWSLKWYYEVLGSSDWKRAALNSCIVAPMSTLIATTLGTLAAVGLTRIDFFGKKVVQLFLLMPMTVPIIVVAVSAYLYFSRIGLGASYTALILVHAALGAPFVVTTVSATLRGFNINLARASLSMGAGQLRTFFDVTLPQILPGVVSGALFAFAASFDEVVVTLFLAGPSQTTLPRQMFTGIRENISPAIAAVATLLVVFTVLLLGTTEWLRVRASRLQEGR